MKEKILALLIAKFAGVRKDGLALLAKQLDLQVTTEADAQALVDKLTVEKVTDFVKDWRAEVDKEITTANTTHEKTLKEKFDFVEKGKVEPGKGDPDPNKGKGDPKDLATQITEAVAAAVKPLQDKLAGIESGKTSEVRKQALEAKLTDVPDEFKSKILKDFGRMSFQKDDDFDNYLKETDTDIAALKQSMADSGLGQQGKPNLGQVNKDGVSKAVETYVTDVTKASTQFEGKKV